jgi:hypothetical protein
MLLSKRKIERMVEIKKKNTWLLVLSCCGILNFFFEEDRVRV